MTARRAFGAMGTDVLLLLDDRGDDAPGALDAAEAEVRRLERVASRFDAGAELALWNRAGGGAVSADLLRLIRRARALREETGGRFDPTVLGAVCAAGYDRTLAQVAPDGPAAPPAVAGGPIAIDEVTGAVHAPGGLDLGGIAKGWAAERVADLLGVTGPCLVSIGGDIAVRGRRAGGPWPVAVDHGDQVRVIGLHRGAMATSGTDRRRWRRGGHVMHHVIDPATGRPARTDLRRVTVLAGDAATAEAWATALLVAGRDAAGALARDAGLTTVLVGEDNLSSVTGDLA